MFNTLSDKLQVSFKKLRGHGKLTESNIQDAMRDIRLALLEADVNIEIVKEFVAAVKEDCLGEEVLKSVSPGQQLIKIVNDRLVELMGESESPLELHGKPSVIMMVGLHGSGKTTTTGKLAARLKKEGKKVLLVAADLMRPAAIDQLEFLGKDLNVPVFANRSNPNVLAITQEAMSRAHAEHFDVVIFDTAGRLQIDTALVQELVQLKSIVNPDECLLVADSALGQEAVSVADHFHKALTITGVILTKVDGDARGGAALSIRKVTNCPIKFIGVGEKIEDLEMFYPDRLASRILGMGDVVSLVEKAAEQIDEEEALKLQEKLKKSQFDFEDFLGQLRQMRKMGGMGAIMKMLPGGKDLAGLVDENSKQFTHMEAIICSMTKPEREDEKIISMQRRNRIAKGSGTSVDQVSQLIKQFGMMKKMMKKMGVFGKMFGGGGGGGMPDMSSLLGGLGGGMGGGMPAGAMGGMGGMMGGLPKVKSGTNFTPSKKKKKKKKKR